MVEANDPSRRDAGQARVVLGMVGDKWSLLIVCHLEQGPQRFTELKRSIHGISQRMLTVTLRNLERDGILTRTVHSVMPPCVVYELTPFGETLYQAATPLVRWTMDHLADIEQFRADYDRRSDTPT